MSLDSIDLDRAALLVIDMQNASCHPEGITGVSGLTARSVIEPVRQLVEDFQAHDRPVIWTQEIHVAADASHARKELRSHTERSHTEKGARVSPLSGSWEAEIIEELADLVTDPTMVVRKHRYGAFHQTRLDALLRMLGVGALFITGTSANASVETSMREAYLHDYDVVAVTDAIGTVHPEWLEAAHAVWAQYLGAVSDSQEVSAWLRHASAPRAKRVHHLLLECVDLEASERFYVDVLGIRVRARDTHRDGRPLVLTENGLGLTEGGTASGGTIEHLAIEVRGVDALAEAAKSAGAEIVRGPGPGPYGHTVYVRDPDRNEIELFEQSRDG